MSISLLPDEILEFIFGHLPPYDDLENCRAVCERWSHIVESKEFLFVFPCPWGES